MPPIEKPSPRQRRPAGEPATATPAPSPGVSWLDDFMAREGIATARRPQSSAAPSGEPPPLRDAERAPATKSYKQRYAFGAALVVVVAVIGAIAFLPPPPPPAAPVRTASGLRRLPDHPHERLAQRAASTGLRVASAPTGDPDSGYTGFPLQPVEPLPQAMSRWSFAPVFAPVPATAPKGAATVAPPVPRPPVPRPAAPMPAASRPPATIASAAASASLPSGTPLHLQIIYTPSSPEEAARVASLTARLRAEVDGIATSGSSVAPVETEVVAYFFADDRAGAAAVAASLARLTKRTEPVKLLHRKPLPRPGTVEILLPLKSGKDLTHESS